MLKKISISTVLTYGLLFVCIFTSYNWGYDPLTAKGEIIRFDKILLFGQATIYHLFAGLFFLILFFKKFGPNSDRNILGDRNYLKTTFWMYFIPVNILIYLTVCAKDITLIDLGVQPIVKFFVYLVVTFYIQDIFFRYKERRQLTGILTALELLILSRCCYSIGKYLLGFGKYIAVIEGLRLGQENDFADFFVLLFIISLVRLLFDKDASIRLRLLHMSGILASSYVGIFSFRRYFWAELLAATGTILFFHCRFNKIDFNKKVAGVCCSIVLILGSILFVGVDKAVDNRYVGRLLTMLTLVNPQFASQHGTDTGHRAEIADGWYNVKKNWLLGLTPFGQDKMERFETEDWQSGLFVHNAYLYVWLVYGLLGLVLFVFLYLKSLQLGYIVFFRLKNEAGLILMTFMACQIIKNIVWATALFYINTTIIYIFLISLVLRLKQLAGNRISVKI